MKKLTYFRKFESTSGECDFETFQELLFDLSDEFECESYDVINCDLPGAEFQCSLSFPVVDMDNENGYFTIDDIYLNQSFLSDKLPNYEDPKELEFEDIYDSIKHNETQLKFLKSKLDSIIENNSKIEEIFKTLEDVIDRFQNYSNFEKCVVGYDIDIITIYFIKK